MGGRQLFALPPLSHGQRPALLRMLRTLTNRRSLVIRPIPLFFSVHGQHIIWWNNTEYIEQIGSLSLLLLNILGRDSGYVNQSFFYQPGIEPIHCLTHAIAAESMTTAGHPTDACVRVRIYDGNVGYFTVAISQPDSFWHPFKPHAALPRSTPVSGGS
jgi:hypothetical protein